LPFPGAHGQQHWPEGHPECGGRSQSPIDIGTRGGCHLGVPTPTEGRRPPSRPAAVLELPPSLRIEGLPGNFVAAQLHFHGGRPGRAAGAEHLVDGHRAPAEVGPDPHPAYDNILNHLGSIRYAGQSVAVPSFGIPELLPPRPDLYYRYNGSLTTPPCSQSVTWTLFQRPVRIGGQQLEQLQGALYSTPEAEPEPRRLVDNFRLPQELNQRRVLAS
ncbi:CAH14 anhydrase, partial [Baryphthengus martii]|nr:CAH14 anhydrase [Baryphthengus martii]